MVDLNNSCIIKEKVLIAIKTMDKVYNVFKNSKLVQDIAKDIYRRNNNSVIRNIEEKSIDVKILNSIKNLIIQQLKDKQEDDVEKFIWYLNNIVDSVNLVEKYSIYKLLIDKMGIRQKLINNVCYNPSKEEIKSLINEFNLRTNSNIIGVLNSLSK